MSNFTTPLEITPLGAKNCWATTRDLFYDVGYEGSYLTIKVPKGFETDLATIPTIFQWLVKPHDPKFAAAAVLHDYLYKHESNGQRFTRAVADAIFYEACLVLGTPKWKAKIMYLGVRVFNAWGIQRTTS